MFIQDQDGEYKEFAMLETRTGMLPIGTQAQASIFYGEAYTANATVELPSGAVEMTIREQSKFSYAAKVFNTEPVTLEFGSVQVPDQTVKIQLDGQTLGELDSDSVEQLKAFNYLENGKPLNLKLVSISETGNQAFVLGCSPNGNRLKINKISFYDFSGQIFDDKDYRRVTIEMPPKKTRDAAFLNGELLGVLHFKKDKDALRQFGLLKPGQLTPISTTLQSNFSHTFIKIDPTTIKYPQVWTKEFQVFGRTDINTAQQLMIETSLPILQKIKERPTFLFATGEDKKLLGMAVDNHKVETVTKWLTSQKVLFSQLPPKDVMRETTKGLAVFNLVSSSILPKTFENMTKKFGTVIESTGKYHQKVRSLPKRP